MIFNFVLNPFTKQDVSSHSIKRQALPLSPSSILLQDSTSTLKIVATDLSNEHELLKTAKQSRKHLLLKFGWWLSTFPGGLGPAVISLVLLEACRCKRAYLTRHWISSLRGLLEILLLLWRREGLVLVDPSQAFLLVEAAMKIHLLEKEHLHASHKSINQKKSVRFYLLRARYRGIGYLYLASLLQFQWAKTLYLNGLLLKSGCLNNAVGMKSIDLQSHDSDIYCTNDFDDHKQPCLLDSICHEDTLYCDTSSTAPVVDDHDTERESEQNKKVSMRSAVQLSVLKRFTHANNWEANNKRRSQTCDQHSSIQLFPNIHVTCFNAAQDASYKDRLGSWQTWFLTRDQNNHLICARSISTSRHAIIR